MAGKRKTRISWKDKYIKLLHSIIADLYDFDFEFKRGFKPKISDIEKKYKRKLNAVTK